MPHNQDKAIYSTAAEALPDLGLESLPDVWQSAWEESAALFKELRQPFPEIDSLRRGCRAIGLSDEVETAILEAATEIAAAPALSQLARLCHWLLFESGIKELATRTWPTLPSSPLFYAVVLLSGWQRTFAGHAARRIDPAVSRATLADLELWMRHYRNKHGAWGLAEFNWLRGHFEGKIYALGRLQFELTNFSFDYRLLQQRQTERLILLGNVGQTQDAQHFSGTPVHPTGRILGHTIQLPKSEWKQILQKGDPTLAIHIPATGPMDFDACGDSLQRALEFFPRHFPDYPFAAFTCHSWLLDSQFEDYLPARSNIVRFLREMYLFPVPDSSDTQTMDRVFGEKPRDLTQAPRNTTLRRAVLDHMLKGGNWYDAGGLLVPHQLEWGTCRYRKNFPDL